MNLDLDLYKIIEKLIIAARTISIGIQDSIHVSENINKTNSSGDSIKYLDILAHTTFLTMLSGTSVHSIVGEESDEPILINGKGKYRVVFDPLDGSSNIGNNSTIGSIFSIYENTSPAGFLRKGKDQIVAGYALYGPKLEVVLCINNTITSSFYSPSHKKMIESEKAFNCPKNGKIYSINYCNKNKWLSNVIKTNSLIIDSGKFTLRYSGSLVADVHRILLEGGIFAYHGDLNNPNGKLRLLYECFPMAKIIEAAGGLAINDAGQRILDLNPTSIHEKSSIIIGSYDLVDKFYARFKR